MAKRKRVIRRLFPRRWAADVVNTGQSVDAHHPAHRSPSANARSIQKDDFARLFPGLHPTHLLGKVHQAIEAANRTAMCERAIAKDMPLERNVLVLSTDKQTVRMFFSAASDLYFFIRHNKTTGTFFRSINYHSREWAMSAFKGMRVTWIDEENPRRQVVPPSPPASG